MSRIRTSALTSIPLLLITGAALAQDVPATAEQPAESTVVEAQATPETAETSAESTQIPEQPLPTTAAEPAALPAEPTAGDETLKPEVGASWNADLAEVERRYQWHLQIGGYLRTKFQWIQNDDTNDIYGRNDGFALANARLTVAGNMRDTMGFRLQFDGAVNQAVTGATRPVNEVDTQVKDAFMWWKPIQYARLTAGHFKPPFDSEEAASTADQLFVNNSVGSEGVGGVEGFGVDGLSRDREAGLMVDADPIFFNGKDGVGVRYALAATNGSPAHIALNDNESLAYYGRVELHYDELVRLGGAAYTNTETLRPEAADQVQRDVFGWTSDLSVHVAGASLLGSMIQTTATYEGAGPQPEVTSTAYQVSVAYQEPYFGFQPTLRYAYLDPSSATSGQSNDVLFEADERTFYTVGLNYNPRYPVRVLLNYTVTAEGDSVALDNDRFDAVLQVSW